MNPTMPPPVSAARLKIFARIAALFSAIVGILVLGGWAFDVKMMKTVLPGLATMKPNTALCIIGGGISVWLFAIQDESKLKRWFTVNLSWMLGLVVLVIAALTLCEYVFGWDLRIDQLIFTDIVPDGRPYPGRMAPHTAISFLLFGAALLLLPVETKRGYLPSQFLSLFSGLISLTSIIGYLYSVVSFYHIASYTGMALHTAVCIFLLSHAIFFVYPERGLAAAISSETLGGVIARRLLPAALFVPLVIGWFGMEGQKAGLYGTEFGLALMVALNVVVFTAWIYVSGRHIHQIAVARTEAEQARQELNYTLQALIDAFPLPVVAMDCDARIQTWNRAAEGVFGWSSLQVRAKPNPIVCADRKEEYKTFLEIMAKGDPVLGLDTVVQNIEEEKIPIMWWGSPIIFGTRGMIGYITIMEDLRERNKLEAKIRDLQAGHLPVRN